MTAPRWISDAIEAGYDMRQGGDPDVDRIAAALIERLPLEAMVTALASFEGGGWMRPETVKMAATVMRVLSDGDPEVVELAELYQGACRALDAAGVPYAVDAEEAHLEIGAVSGEMSLRKPVEVEQVPAHPAQQRLDLAGRIRWLAQQRPTRIDLARVEAERDLARTMHQDAERAFAAAMTERDAARADLARERREHEEAENAGSNRELELRTMEDQIQRKVVDQAAYIEQLEVEIDALEDEIWQDEP